MIRKLLRNELKKLKDHMKEDLKRRNEETNNQLLNHKRRLNDLTWKNAALEYETQELKRDYDQKVQELKGQNEALKYETQKIKNDFEWEVQQLKGQNEALMQEKRREQQNIYNFKMSFEGSKKNIEKINLERSKEYITKLIVNKFVKEFDNEEGKKILLLFH